MQKRDFRILDSLFRFYYCN